MATIKQQKAVEKLVENGGNVTLAMRESGYSGATVNNPTNLTSSKGYKQILADYGLTTGFIVANLVSDIKNKPEKRLGELTLASDLLGLRKKALVIEDKREDEMTPEQRKFVEEQARVFEEYYYAKLSNSDSVTIAIDGEHD